MRIWMEERPFLSAAIAMALGLAAGAGVASLGSNGDDGGEPAAGSEPGREAAEPGVTHDVSCDHRIGDGREGHGLVAGGSMRNTGNIGVEVRARASWPQSGAEPVTHEEIFRIEPGDTKTLAFDLEATDDQIDRLQTSLEGCDVEVTIVESFGQPSLE